MAAIENILAWAKEERARLTRRLEELQSGRLRTYEKHAQPPGWLEIDTTERSIELDRRSIGELGAIIALHPAVVPTAPVSATPVARFIPPASPEPAEPAAPPAQPEPQREGLLRRLLHAGTTQQADWVVGWGVVKGQPPRWEFAGIYQSHAEAAAAAAAAGEGYYARWGSYNAGSREFTSGPSFDRADSL